MPVMQQQSTSESMSSADSSVSSPTGSSRRNITDLLGLSLPRGPILGQSSQMWPPPIQRPGNQHQVSSLIKLDNHVNSFESLQQASSMPQPVYKYDFTQSLGPISPLQMPQTIKESPPYSDCSSPVEQALLQLASRSNSPSDSVGSNGSSDLLEIINNLSISPPGGICSPPTEQELTNLRALHTLTNNLCTPSVNPQLLLSWLHTFPTSPNCNRQNAVNNNVEVLEKVASFHRNQAATFFNVTTTWRGVLPTRFISENPTYSCKVFLGGVPWDVTEDILIQVFSQFGNVQVEWPGKEQPAMQPKGYVYIIFESEKQVKALIHNCKREVSPGNSVNWYFRISSRKLKSKEVQVIPWCLSDSNYMQYSSHKLDPRNTVFVGALHGMLNAEGLFKIMNELFGGVIYAGIDTDKFRYPIGSARVCFDNQTSYLNAVAAAFIEIKTIKFVKKVQVDPYLEDSPCSGCWVRQGPYFCRDMGCFRYFCHSCWMLHHQFDFNLSHKLITRGSKTRMPSLSKMRSPYQ